jgi:hypothetical protein
MNKPLHLLWIVLVGLVLFSALDMGLTGLFLAAHTTQPAAFLGGLLLTGLVMWALASHIQDHTLIGRMTLRLLTRILFPFD